MDAILAKYSEVSSDLSTPRALIFCANFVVYSIRHDDAEALPHPVSAGDGHNTAAHAWPSD